jgi:H+-translocating NAD(P) transhydrogenase subunit alpha
MSAAIITAVFIFTLATLAGAEVINKVPPTLHTPLMSGANAVSGIALIGAILVAGNQDISTASILGFIAIVLATINVVGGFLVTDRMLQMFKKKAT